MNPADRAPSTAAPLSLGTARVELRAERCIWWPATGTLLVADLHWGKDATFRAHGLPVPRGDLELDLARLTAAVRATGARRLVVLGDLVHDAHSLDRHVVERVAAARRAELAGLEWLLVRGNHDRHVPHMPASWRLREVAEPFFVRADDGATVGLAHDAAAARRRTGSSDPVADHWFAGHLHPTVRLEACGDRLRLPCFHVTEELTTLPAFSLFTNGPPVRRGANDRVFAIADDHVVEV